MRRDLRDAKEAAAEQVLWWRSRGYRADEVLVALGYGLAAYPRWEAVQRLAATIWLGLAHDGQCRPQEQT